MISNHQRLAPGTDIFKDGSVVYLTGVFHGSVLRPSHESLQARQFGVFSKQLSKLKRYWKWELTPENCQILRENVLIINLLEDCALT